jgi:hypothetical protein
MTKKVTALILAFCSVFSILSFVASAEGSAAETFIENVDLIEIADGLSEKENYLTAATDALDEYKANGGSVTDDAIASHYASYEAYKAEIEAEIALHFEFMDEVNLAVETQNDAYPIFKAHMNRAAEILPLLDKSYEGMSYSLNLYNGLIYEFKEKEEICELYKDYAERAATATTYKEVDKYVTEAGRIYSNVKIPDYPGLDEAAKKINDAKTFMGQCELEAAPFLSAVTDLPKAVNLPRAIKEAYALLEKIDSTTAGVDVALTTLRSEERKYNRAVDDANAMIEEIGALSLVFIF